MRSPAALLSLTLSLGLAAQEAPRPNVILILADDAGLGDFGCYGGTRIATPNIDRLAAEGMRFTSFYSGGSLCVPSRCALMTGKHMGHAAVRLNGPFPLPEAEVTLAEVLRDAGYRTACIGKWALGRDPREGGSPLLHGFDTYFGFIDQTPAHRYYPPHLFQDYRRVVLEENPTRRDRYSQDLFTAEALRFLEAHEDGPFFLYLPYCLPHADLDVPEDSLAVYRGKLGDETAYVENPRGRVYNDQPTPRAAYAAMVSRLDREVGRILESLAALGIDEQTLVLFSSDNGASSEGGTDPAFFASTAGLRGGKRSLYEGGIRAPLLARWPGKIEAGSTSSRLAASWDLLATCAELAGAPVPPATDGISLAPELLGTPADRETHDYLYWESKDFEWGSLQAARFEGWKAVRTGAERRGAKLELYDLAADPGETRDVAAENPEVVARAERILAEAHVAHPRSPLLPAEFRVRAKPKDEDR